LGQANFASFGQGSGQIGLFRPYGVAVDRDSSPNHLYVADQGNARVLGWKDANALLSAGSPPPADMVIGEPNFDSNIANGTISGSTLGGPSGLAIDSNGNLYVADGGFNRVLEYTSPYTTFETLLGHKCTAATPCLGGLSANMVFGQGSTGTGGEFASAGNGTAPTAMSNPQAVAVDSSNNLYVADFYNNRVLEFDDPLDATAPCAAAGNPGCAGDAVADNVFGQGGSFSTSVCTDGLGSDPPVSATGLCMPTGLAFDSNGNFYVSDSNDNRVLVFGEPTGASPNNFAANFVFGQGTEISLTTANSGTGPLNLNQPWGIAIDSNNNVYIADMGNNRVLEFNEPPSGPNNVHANLVLGQGSSGSEFSTKTCGANVNASNSTLCSPPAITVDASGDLFASDPINNRVLEFIQPLLSVTATPTATMTPSPTLTSTATPTTSATTTSTSTSTPTASATPTATTTPTETATATPSATPTSTATSTATTAPTTTPTATPIVTATPTAMPTPDGAKIVVPRSVNLKAVGIGTGAASNANLTIRNAGKGGNLIGNVSLNPVGLAISISNPGAFSIALGQKIVEKVSCKPDALTDSASIGIHSNDPARAAVNVPVKCFGLAGELSAPKSVSISGPVGSSASAPFIIRNIGKGILSGTVGAATSSYSVSSGAGPFGPLAPNGTKTVRVGFTPTSKGKADAGSLSITVDAPSAGGASVTLKGIGK
jgi:sugar lactone lactonase YvrE